MARRSEAGPEMRMTEFKVGDVVRLKSGGPPMTIVYIDNEFSTQLSCRWFVEGHEVRHDQFPPAALKYAEDQQ